MKSDFQGAIRAKLFCAFSLQRLRPAATLPGTSGFGAFSLIARLSRILPVSDRVPDVADDRKYRHRGYMDSGSSPSHGPRAPEEARPSRSDGAPRGRSAGFEKDLIVACKKCGQKASSLDPIESETACSRCGSPLHSCAQCANFDSSARWECTQHAKIPARIPVKTAANACPLYAPLASFDMTGAKAADSPSDARRAFDALFKK